VLLAIQLTLFSLVFFQRAFARETLHGSDTLVYLNESLVGIYEICVHPEDKTLYLEGSFFERVRLQKLSDNLICDGRPFWKTKVRMERFGGQNMVKAQVTQLDYERTPQEGASIPYESSLVPVGPPMSLFALQHETGFWFEQTKMTSMTLGLSGKRYSPFGLFMVDGYASAVNGQFQGYLRDASWRRNFPEKSVSARFGLNIINNIGVSTTLYGLVLESDRTNRPLNEVRSMQGFADVPGRIQIRVKGVLIKEVPISAGHFNLPLSELTSGSSGNGQYAITLVDDSGREVRSWNEFMPITPRLLASGEADWKVFLGKIRNNADVNKLTLSGLDNIGTGFLYRYGINKYLTSELTTTIGKSSHGGGLALDFIPTPWLAISSGEGRFLGVNSNKPKRSTYWGVDLHTDRVSWYSGYTQQSCSISNSSIGGENVCKNLRHSLQFQAGRIGRLSFLTSSSIDSRPVSSSIGFNWSLGSLRRWDISIYGTKQRTENDKSLVFGLMVTIPLDGAHLLSSINMNGTDNHSRTDSLSTSYTRAISNEMQYSMGADVIQQPFKESKASFSGSANYRPWYGVYQANVRVRNDGSYSMGMNETGGLVMLNSHVVPTRTVESGVAVFRLSGLSNKTVEDNNGNIKSVTDHDGYAAVSAYGPGVTPLLKVAAEELPTNIKLPSLLVGRNPDTWTATYWEPEVRNVRQGWLRLIYKSGDAVPIGSVLNIGDPAYVLENGEVYVEDLPHEVTSVSVTTPGDRSRCLIQLPFGIELKTQYSARVPTLLCY